MINIISKVFFSIWLVFLFASCVSQSKASITNAEKSELKSVVCSAENFLKKNGYYSELEVSQIDTDSLTLELWDELNYKIDGQFDWRAVLSERANTFTDNLYGVSRKQGEQHLVFYQFSDHYRCVGIDSGSNEIHLHEANCLVNDQIVPSASLNLDC